ncbi:MAG: ATP-dependent Clp protease ATP-binding subunit [Parcubacteria group bacterium]|nr:ATP-dependent Clp protease ATP-binding subunit [Parcubacteria group bacterium]
MSTASQGQMEEKKEEEPHEEAASLPEHKAREPRKIFLNPDQNGSLAQEFIALCENEYVGQPRLVEYAVDCLDRLESYMKTGSRLPDAEGVIGSVLIPGPSGVGKTLLAKLLAKVLTGHKRGFFFIPGQNYQERHALESLLGAPDGYIGSDKEPLLTQEKLDQPGFLALRERAYKALAPEEAEELADLEKMYKADMIKANALQKAVSKTADKSKLEDVRGQLVELQARLDTTINKVLAINPHIVYDPTRQVYPSVILCDEFEKAHEALQRFFLGALGDGAIENRRGDVIDFRGSIVLFTSNLCKDEIARFVAEQSGETFKLGFQTRPQNSSGANTGPTDDTELYRYVRDKAEKAFGVEFMGRLDEFILARMLVPEDIRTILDAKINAYLKYLVETFPIKLDITEPVVNFMFGRATRKRVEGARLLDKELKKYIYGPLDRLRLTGQIKEGDHVVVELPPRGKKQKRPTFAKMEYENGNGGKLLRVEYKKRRNHKPPTK